MTEPGGGLDDGRPASRRVADELRSAIEVGTYAVGSALPPLRQIATDHQVAVNTAMAAVRLLADEGYVTGKPNAGNYVRDRSGQVDPAEQLRALRTELGELQAKVRQVGGDLAAIEQRLADVSDVVVTLENQNRP